MRISLWDGEVRGRDVGERGGGGGVEESISTLQSISTLCCCQLC